MGVEPLTHQADLSTGTTTHTIDRRGRAFASHP